MHPILLASIFQSGGSGSPPFKASEQRLYIVFGRETTRLTVNSQKLFTVIDNSSVTDFRYWRILIYGPAGNTYYRVAECQFRESLGGADVATELQTIFGPEGTGIGTFDAAHAFDDDSGTQLRMITEFEGCWFGQDFGAGNETEIVEVVMTAGASASDANEVPRKWELQGSNDLHDWRTTISVNDASGFSGGESRTYN